MSNPHVTEDSPDARDVDAQASDRLMLTFMALSVSVLAFVAMVVASRPELWVDEKITLILIERWNIYQIITILPQRQPHYPTYYVLLELAGARAGFLLSAISYPVTVAGTILAASELTDRRRSQYAAAMLVATSPYLATQAGWLRMYAALTALMTLVLWLGLRGTYRAAAAVSLLAASLHPFGWFASAWVCLLYARRRAWWQAAGLGGVASVPLVVFLAVKSTSTGAVTSSSSGMGHGIQPGLLKTVLLPTTALTGGPHLSVQVILSLFVLVLLLWPRADLRLLAWIGLPIVGIVTASYLVHPLFRPKYFGMIAPAVALWVAVPDREVLHRRVLYIALVGLIGTMWFFRVFGLIVTRRYFFWF